MSLLFCESWDHLSTATIVSKWREASIGSGTTVGAGRFGNGLRINVNNSSAMGGRVRFTESTPSTIFVGMAMFFSSGHAYQQPQVTFLEGNVAVHADLMLLTGTNQLRARGPGGVTLGDSVLTITRNTWYYVQIKLVVHDTLGAFQVYVGPDLFIDVSNVDTRNAAAGFVDTLQLGVSSGGGGTPSYVINFDDLYVCDGVDSGVPGAPNNTYLGDVRVEAIFPNGNGNSSQLVGSDGNSTDNYLLVDEPSPSDADYVESATVGEKDTYAFGAVTPVNGAVYGVQVVPRAAKTDAGIRTFKTVARLAGTETDGPERNLSDTVMYYPDVREAKPGGGAWSLADVNGAEFGVKVQS